ncbi:MAG: hypothetical protein MRY49_01660 [Candidatus Pacebacteria bacterium]|nr:hypothetical protein [Candidatus Paceibacterota bacterium]
MEAFVEGLKVIVIFFFSSVFFLVLSAAIILSITKIMTSDKKKDVKTITWDKLRSVYWFFLISLTVIHILMWGVYPNVWSPWIIDHTYAFAAFNVFILATVFSFRQDIPGTTFVGWVFAILTVVMVINVIPEKKSYNVATTYQATFYRWEDMESVTVYPGKWTEVKLGPDGKTSISYEDTVEITKQNPFRNREVRVYIRNPKTDPDFAFGDVPSGRIWYKAAGANPVKLTIKHSPNE